MEEHKNLYRLADELYDLIAEAEKSCPPACTSSLKEANFYCHRLIEELSQLIPAGPENEI